MRSADLTHAYESSHLKHQESQEGDKTRPLRFETLYRFEIRRPLSDMRLSFHSGSVPYHIRPCVTPAWLLYTQTGRNITLWESDSPSPAKSHRGERDAYYGLLRDKEGRGETHARTRAHTQALKHCQTHLNVFHYRSFHAVKDISDAIWQIKYRFEKKL